MHTRFITALAFAAALVSTGASAATYADVYDFCSSDGCADGWSPWGPAVPDGAGNWYGNATLGGDKHKGTIYRMTLSGKKWTYTRLYSFCAESKCTDGASPQAGLIIDTAGNLYGTASQGGKDDNGVVYELEKNGAGWNYKVLYTFCRHTGCADGSDPFDAVLTYSGAASGLPYDGTSTLYGTTYAGGKNAGVLFTLKPSGGNWTYKVIHTFCAKTNCTDGGTPNMGVMVDSSGDLIGAAPGGGKYNGGVVYELKPNGGGWTYGILHSFCAQKTTTCSGGNDPNGVPIADGAGNLYGTAHMGGANAQGTVYELVPDGAKWKLTTLHTFCGETNCTDGGTPYATLAMDAAGDLLGTSYFGGDLGMGTVFKLSGVSHKKFTRLVSFGNAGTPGGYPAGGLQLDPSGAFYGNTEQGGANDKGVFYKLVP
jgi:uncharacterized repeat protein (TIGR03803 family)